MNNWIKRVAAVAVVIAQFLVIPVVSASSLENVQNKKQSVEKEINQVQGELNDKLSEASDISIALDELETEIQEHQDSIAQTEEDIVEQEEVVQDRYEYTANQLKAMQTNEINKNIIVKIFQAKNLTEFFNTVYTASILTSANEEHLNEAQEEQQKLEDLKEELVVYQEELDSKQEEMAQQKESLDEKLSGLKATLADNQSKLDELNREEANIKEAAKKEEEKTVTVATSETKAVSTSSSSSSSSSEANSTSSEAGSWMTFNSTGYSTQEAGLSTHTATGIDLRTNPRVIAVDPSQIPLGSLVEVKGMGVYVAGDTGGAIKGKKIDIHFPTLSGALNWGRRSVQIRILK